MVDKEWEMSTVNTVWQIGEETRTSDISLVPPPREETAEIVRLTLVRESVQAPNESDGYVHVCLLGPSPRFTLEFSTGPTSFPESL